MVFETSNTKFIFILWSGHRNHYLLMVRYKVFTDIKKSKMATNVYEEAAVHPKHTCLSTNYTATEDGNLIHSNLTSQLI
jgi:hypothetical protein